MKIVPTTSPHAEKVNDLPDDIHGEDFQLLQVNMDYAITKTLLQIVTQIGDQKFFTSVFQNVARCRNFWIFA